MDSMTRPTSGVQQISLDYASISRRFVALVLDVIILVIPTAIGGHIIPVIGGVAVWFLYAPLMEASEMRATLGKHLMGIQVCDISGRRISLKTAVIRNLLKAVSGALLFLGYFIALFTEKKQSFHDLLADTVVVYGRSERSPVDIWVESVKDLFSSSKISAFAGGPDASGAQTLQELERLQALREKGALTEEEFQVAKRKILGDSK